MEAPSDGAQHPGEVLEAHVRAGLARIVGDQRLHGRGVALGHHVEHPPVPRVLALAGDAIVRRIDLVPERGARQAADADDGDPAAETHRLIRRHLPELQRLLPVVIEVVRRHDDGAGAARVEEAIGDDAARIDREAVIVDAARLDPERAAAGDARLCQLGVDLEVVVDLAVLVPVLVDVEAADARPGLPRLVENGEPLGRVDEDDVGPGLVQRGGRLLESAGDLAPWRIVAGEERQGAARNQQGGHHARLRVAPPGEEQGALQAVADAEGFEQLVAAGRGIVQVPQRIDDAHGAPRHHEDDDHGRDSQDQQRILGDAGQHAVDDDEDRGADDGAGQRAHAAGDDDEDEIGRPEDRERGRRRDDHGVDVEETRREAAEPAGDHEDDQLHLADVDAGRPRRLLVVAHCGQREPVAALEQGARSPRSRTPASRGRRNTSRSAWRRS